MKLTAEKTRVLEELAARQDLGGTIHHSKAHEGLIVSRRLLASMAKDGLLVTWGEQNTRRGVALTTQAVLTDLGARLARNVAGSSAEHVSAVLKDREKLDRKLAAEKAAEDARKAWIERRKREGL